MINEVMLAVLLAYGVAATAMVEKLKPTLRHLLKEFKRDTPKNKAVVFQIAAAIIVAFFLLGDPETRFMGIIGKTPQNTVWQGIDLAISCVLAFLSTEASHRLIDVARVFFGLKEAPNV